MQGWKRLPRDGRTWVKSCVSPTADSGAHPGTTRPVPPPPQKRSQRQAVRSETRRRCRLPSPHAVRSQERVRLGSTKLRAKRHGPSHAVPVFHLSETPKGFYSGATTRSEAEQHENNDFNLLAMAPRGQLLKQIPAYNEQSRSPLGSRHEQLAAERGAGAGSVFPTRVLNTRGPYCMC